MYPSEQYHSSRKFSCSTGRYICTVIRTYVLTDVRTCIYPSIHTYIPTSIHPHIQTFIHAYMRKHIFTFLQFLTYLIILTYLLHTYIPTYLLIHTWCNTCRFRWIWMSSPNDVTRRECESQGEFSAEMAEQYFSGFLRHCIIESSLAYLHSYIYIHLHKRLCIYIYIYIHVYLFDL